MLFKNNLYWINLNYWSSCQFHKRTFKSFSFQKDCSQRLPSLIHPPIYVKVQLTHVVHARDIPGVYMYLVLLMQISKFQNISYILLGFIRKIPSVLSLKGISNFHSISKLQYLMNGIITRDENFHSLSLKAHYMSLRNNSVHVLCVDQSFSESFLRDGLFIVLLRKYIHPLYC